MSPCCILIAHAPHALAGSRCRELTAALRARLGNRPQAALDLRAHTAGIVGRAPRLGHLMWTLQPGTTAAVRRPGGAGPPAATALGMPCGPNSPRGMASARGRSTESGCWGRFIARGLGCHRLVAHRRLEHNAMGSACCHDSGADLHLRLGADGGEEVQGWQRGRLLGKLAENTCKPSRRVDGHHPASRASSRGALRFAARACPRCRHAEQSHGREGNPRGAGAACMRSTWLCGGKQLHDRPRGKRRRISLRPLPERRGEGSCRCAVSIPHPGCNRHHEKHRRGRQHRWAAGAASSQACGCRRTAPHRRPDWHHSNPS